MAFADSIEPVQNLGGAVSFPVGFLVEESAQTFLYGTPVMVKAADGGLQAWDGATLPGIAGIAAEQANNLGSTGSGAPQGFTPVVGIGSVVGNYAANANQPLAVITPPMVPTSDGRIRFFIAAPGTVFSAKLGTTNVAAATTNAQVGTSAGLTKDTNNLWFVDTAKSNSVQIVGLDQREPVGTVGGHVLFVFLPTAAVVQLFA